MIFTKFEILHLKPKLKKDFETSFGRFDHNETLLVKSFTKEGLVGFGEAPAMQVPFYNYESSKIATLVLKEYILPQLLNKEINSVDELIKTYSPIRGHNMAKTGIEAAFWHIKSQEENKPLWALWGGVRKEVEAGISLGLEKSVEEILIKVEKVLAKGFKRIKIKIKPGMDVKVARSVREKFGNISLMLDANSAYQLRDLPIFKELDQFNLLKIEQPLSYDDIIDHAKLQREIKTPICLDESIHSLDDARKAIESGACKIINIKPPRVGGFWQSKLMAELCEKNNIPVWCGGLLETGWGKAFNVHISSLNNFKLAGDTSGSDAYYTEDIIEPLMVVRANSQIDVPQEGVGFQINQDALKRITINTVEITS